MAALIARREAEGLTWSELSESTGVPLSTLTYWRKKLEAQTSQENDGTFVELLMQPSNLPVPSTGIDLISPSGIRFSIGPDFDETTLRRLLAVLSC